LPGDIATRQRNRQRFRLNRRAGDESSVANTLLQGVRQLQLVEFKDWNRVV
jgi:hypothetical protein